MRIDAHHHLWDLSAVHYPWLMARGVRRFFGDPGPIQRNYLLEEFRAAARGFEASVHIQVGAEDAFAEASWVQDVADANPEWSMAQVVFADLASERLGEELDRMQELPTVRGVRQIVGRAPEEDRATGTNDLLDDPRFVEGLREVGRRGLSFDLQIVPELYGAMADVLSDVPGTRVALCHAGSPHDRSPDGLKAWARDLGRLSGLSQVSVKLSGLGMFEHDWTRDSVRPVVEACLGQFGMTRCMFGSNFPVDSLYSDYGAIVEAYETLVPGEAHLAVFGDTAAAFYGFVETRGDS
ncbi:MAG: amidohydrolase family protein [Boseongicola sp. SB0675_bin_26]|nr:amidohydrolase family protein [Boseongicola sp. SB0675_bin_26]